MMWVWEGWGEAKNLMKLWLSRQEMMMAWTQAETVKVVKSDLDIVQILDKL